MDGERYDFDLDLDGPPLDVELAPEPDQIVPPPPAPSRARRRPVPSSRLPEDEAFLLRVLALAMVLGIGVERILLLVFMPGGKVVGLSVMSALFILTSVSGLIGGAVVMERAMRR